MSPLRAWRIMRKDLALGPRSPLLPYAVVLPLVATALIRVVFLSLFDPAPRLGVVDEGASHITAAVQEIEGIDVSVISSETRLREMVEANDLDAGLVLPAGFDDAVRAGRRPEMRMFLGGESLASNRIVLAVTAADLVRDVAGVPAPIDVDVQTIGDADPTPVASRLVPLIMFYAVVIAGLFLPAAGLVEEKVSGTLSALLVTPARITDVAVGKGAVGFALALAMGAVTLAINGAFGSDPLALMLALIVAALMSVEIGLMLGAWAKDANTLFTAMKGGGVFLAAPSLFFIWPDLPQWIARVFPTYYFLGPLFDIGVRGASLVDAGRDIAIGFGICAALLPLVYAGARRMEARVVAG